MRSFVKLVAVLAVGLVAAAGAFAQKADDDKSKDKDAKESGAKKGKKDKKSNKPADPAAPQKAIDVPVPKGHDAKGLKIPYFGSDGKLQMSFNIGVASRLDDNHMQMTDLQIETFNDDGEHEMAIDLPTSVLDLTTSVISTKKHVTIRRDDFELTGETMEFNTRTKQGGLGGNVRMLIYNLEAETSGSSESSQPTDK
jgi:hypothetical protein